MWNYRTMKKLSNKRYQQINHEIAKKIGATPDFVTRFRSSLFSQPFSGDLTKYSEYIETKIAGFEVMFNDVTRAIEARKAAEKLSSKPEKHRQKIAIMTAMIANIKKRRATYTLILNFIDKTPKEKLDILCERIEA